MAKLFITIGIVFILVGIFMMIFKNFSLFNLPGDLSIKQGSFSFYFPVTTSVILSVVFSLAFYLVGKIFR